LPPFSSPAASCEAFAHAPLAPSKEDEDEEKGEEKVGDEEAGAWLLSPQLSSKL
jgi:hypothetical protein